MDNIKILNKTANEIEFEIEDESHGVCNALRHILMQDEDVEYAFAPYLALGTILAMFLGNQIITLYFSMF